MLRRLARALEGNRQEKAERPDRSGRFRMGVLAGLCILWCRSAGIGIVRAERHTVGSDRTGCFAPAADGGSGLAPVAAAGTRTSDGPGASSGFPPVAKVVFVAVAAAAH